MRLVRGHASLREADCLSTPPWRWPRSAAARSPPGPPLGCAFGSRMVHDHGQSHPHHAVAIRYRSTIDTRHGQRLSALVPRHVESTCIIIWTSGAFAVAVSTALHLVSAATACYPAMLDPDASLMVLSHLAARATACYPAILDPHASLIC